jgi:hypothetical protein
MSAIVRKLRGLFTKKITQKEILTQEMLRELRSIRLNEQKQAEQIRQLKADLELAKHRHKVYAEQIKVSYLRIFKKKLLEIRGQQAA